MKKTDMLRVGNRQVNSVKLGWILSAIAVAMAGCGGDDGSATTTPTTPGAPIAVNQADVQQKLAAIPRAPAGEPVTLLGSDPYSEYMKVAQNVPSGRRNDPFSLMGAEAKFETGQQRERLAVDVGGWWPGLEYTEPVPKPTADELPMEQLPQRRLAGILLGDGASALIVMEDGRIYDIRPGSRVGNTEWTVLSIDANKAVLVRDPSKRPSRQDVYLDGAAGGPGGGQPGGNGGQPGGGQPGGRPGQPGEGGNGAAGEIF